VLVRDADRHQHERVGEADRGADELAEVGEQLDQTHEHDEDGEHRGEQDDEAHEQVARENAHGRGG
jgi:hypothetical protein